MIMSVRAGFLSTQLETVQDVIEEFPVQFYAEAKGTSNGDKPVALYFDGINNNIGYKQLGFFGLSIILDATNNKVYTYTKATPCIGKSIKNIGITNLTDFVNDLWGNRTQVSEDDGHIVWNLSLKKKSLTNVTTGPEGNFESVAVPKNPLLKVKQFEFTTELVEKTLSPSDYGMDYCDKSSNEGEMDFSELIQLLKE